MKWRWALAGVYATALLASAVMRNGRAEPAVPRDMNAIALKAVGGRGETVRVTYREYAGPLDATPVVLIDGSPGSSDVLAALASMLAPARRVLVPDLPGFGFSTTHIPDYSFRAHAHYLRDLLVARGLGKVQVLAFSMGGGVALSLGEMIQSTRVVTMVSAIGLQEMELLGETTSITRFTACSRRGVDAQPRDRAHRQPRRAFALRTKLLRLGLSVRWRRCCNVFACRCSSCTAA